MGKSGDFELLKRFTELVDDRFYLEADGHPALGVSAGIGGVTTGEHSYLMISLGPADWDGLRPGVEYSLRPRNAKADYRWKLTGPMRARR